MENTWVVILTALFSGLVATFITLWWQGKSGKRQEQIEVFKTLMSKRYDLTDPACVDAINRIDVVFYSSNEVRKAWKEFYEATSAPAGEKKNDNIRKKNLRLLEEIAKCVGYKNIKWEDIENYYFPVGLSNKKQDEEILRKVQIDAGIAQLSKQKDNNESAQVSKEEEINRAFVMEAIKNPDGLLKLVEAAEKAQHLGKGNGQVRRR